jgi:hypothetical protein
MIVNKHLQYVLLMGRSRNLKSIVALSDYECLLARGYPLPARLTPLHRYGYLSENRFFV